MQNNTGKRAYHRTPVGTYTTIINEIYRFLKPGPLRRDYTRFIAQILSTHKVGGTLQTILTRSGTVVYKDDDTVVWNEPKPPSEETVAALLAFKKEYERDCVEKARQRKAMETGILLDKHHNGELVFSPNAEIDLKPKHMSNSQYIKHRREQTIKKYYEFLQGLYNFLHKKPRIEETKEYLHSMVKSLQLSATTPSCLAKVGFVSYDTERGIAVWANALGARQVDAITLVDAMNAYSREARQRSKEKKAAQSGKRPYRRWQQPEAPSAAFAGTHPDVRKHIFRINGKLFEISVTIPADKGKESWSVMSIADNEGIIEITA